MRKMQKAKNSQKESSQTAKSEIEWGIVRMRRAGEFIASVGSLSGWWVDDVRTLAASERSRLVVRVQTIYRDRSDDDDNKHPDSIRSCPDMWPPSPSGLQESAVRTSM